MAFSAMNQSEIAEVPNCPRKTEPPTLNRLQSHRIARVFPGRKLFLFLPLKKTSDLLGLAQENKGATAGRNSTCRSSLSSLLFVMSQHLKKCFLLDTTAATTLLLMISHLVSRMESSVSRVSARKKIISYLFRIPLSGIRHHLSAPLKAGSGSCSACFSKFKR